MSNDITYLVNRLGILGTALIALFPEVAEIGIILDLLAFDLNTMAGDAAWLSNEFGSVNSGYDDNDPFWSSFTGLEGMRQDITARLASHRNTYTGVLAGLDTANAMLMQVKQHDLGGDNPTTQQAIGFIDQLTGDVEDVGYGTFAMHTIDLEEQDLNS